MLAAISMARLRGEDGRSETGIRAVAEFATNIKTAPEPETEPRKDLHLVRSASVSEHYASLPQAAERCFCDSEVYPNTCSIL